MPTSGPADRGPERWRLRPPLPDGPAADLGLAPPGPGEFISARLVRCPEDGQLRNYARSIRIVGAGWRLASADDPASPAPDCPQPVGGVDG